VARGTSPAVELVEALVRNRARCGPAAASGLQRVWSQRGPVRELVPELGESGGGAGAARTLLVEDLVRELDGGGAARQVRELDGGGAARQRAAGR
jgi:hypothetical protein